MINTPSNITKGKTALALPSNPAVGPDWARPKAGSEGKTKAQPALYPTLKSRESVPNFGVHLTFLLLPVLMLALACGGGGGTSASGIDSVSLGFGTSPIYSGKSDPVEISLENAEIIYRGLSGNDLGVSSVNEVGVSASTKPFRFTESMNSMSTKSKEKAKLYKAISIEEQVEYSGFGGKATYSGTYDDESDILTISVVFDSYKDSATSSLNGVVDLISESETDFQASFSNLEITEFDEIRTFSGYYTTETNGLFDTTVYEMTAAGDQGDDVIYYNNYVETIERFSHTSLFESSVQGRVFFDSLGYVEVVTTEPAVYINTNDNFPESGASLTIYGKASSKARMTISGIHVDIEMDDEGDGVFESSTQVIQDVRLNTRPDFITSSTLDYSVDRELDFFITAEDIDGHTIEYSSSDLPEFLSLDSQTGRITGSDNVIGVHDFSVVANDGYGDTIVDFHLNLSNTAPIISLSHEFFYVNINEEYAIRIKGVDTDGHSLHYSMIQGPDWLSMDSSTGILSGVAPGERVHTFVEVEVSDGYSTISWSETIYMTAMNSDAWEESGPYYNLE